MPAIPTAYTFGVLGLGVALAYLIGDAGRQLELRRRRREAQKWAAR